MDANDPLKPYATLIIGKDGEHLTTYVVSYDGETEHCLSIDEALARAREFSDDVRVLELEDERRSWTAGAVETESVPVLVEHEIDSLRSRPVYGTPATRMSFVSEYFVAQRREERFGKNVSRRIRQADDVSRTRFVRGKDWWFLTVVEATSKADASRRAVAYVDLALGLIDATFEDVAAGHAGPADASGVLEVVVGPEERLERWLSQHGG